jgi:hypothetical protein
MEKLGEELGVLLIPEQRPLCPPQHGPRIRGVEATRK